VVRNRYELLSVLGIGPYGPVYAALDRESVSPVALKTYRGQAGDRFGPLMRLWKASPLLRAVTSPRCATVHAVILENNDAFVVRDAIQTSSISDLLASEELSLAALKGIAEGVVGALADAWQFGLLHGNLDADNIFQREDGSIVVTDFAIAHALGATGSSATSARRAHVPPELGSGGRIDMRSDMYSLGVLLQTGLRHLTFDKMENPRQMWQADPSSFEAGRAIPGEWMEFVQRLVAAEPSDRFSSYGDLAASVATLPIPDLGASPADIRGAIETAISEGAGERGADVPETTTCISTTAAIPPIDAGQHAPKTPPPQLDSDPGSLKCPVCESDEFTLLRIPSARRFVRLVRGTRFQLSCDGCSHVIQVDEKQFATYNPYSAFERLQRRQEMQDRS
jgi:serine/threonine protein kinase